MAGYPSLKLSGSSNRGIAVNATVRDPVTGLQWYPAGSVFEAFDSAHKNNYLIACAEQGGSGASGCYVLTFPSAITAGVYEILWMKQVGASASWDDDTTVVGGDSAFQWGGTAPVSTVGLLDVAVPASYAAGTVGYQVGRLASASVGVAAPVTTSGVVTIVAGDDYLAADGRQIDFDGPSNNFWPNLTGATVTWNVSDGALVVSGTVVTPTGNQRVRFQPVGTQTDDLTRGNYPYSVKAVLSGGSVVTLALGLAVWRDSEAN